MAHNKLSWLPNIEKYDKIRVLYSLRVSKEHSFGYEIYKQEFDFKKISNIWDEL